MRLRAGAALAFACAALLVVPATGSAATGRAKPSWLTSSLLKKVSAAGARGMSVGEERLNTECPGVQGAGVSAAGCIVAPPGCTADIIFASRRAAYVGNARPRGV